MWGFLIGLYIAVIIYPFIEEWQEQRSNKAALANMRRHNAKGIGGTRLKVNGSTSSRASHLSAAVGSPSVIQFVAYARLGSADELHHLPVGAGGIYNPWRRIYAFRV